MIKCTDVSVQLSQDGARRLTASFDLADGDLAVLLGPNGSGKTTFLDVIAGFRLPDSGRVVLHPQNEPIAYVVQEAANGILPWRTILSNILLPAELRANTSADFREEAMSLLSAFALSDRADDFPYKLSTGERQIVNIIRALCMPASVLLLDEPFAPLNALARSQASTLLRESAARRTTILVTHEPVDLDWPITRYFRVSNSHVSEIDRQEARRVLDGAVPAALS